MNKPAPKEPSMDEILSSIRQIIADDDAAGAPRRPALQAAPPMQASPAKPLSEQIDRDLSDMLEDVEPLALTPSQIVEEGDAEGFSFDSILADTEIAAEEPVSLVEPEDVPFEGDDDLPSFDPAPRMKDPEPSFALLAAKVAEPDPIPVFRPEPAAPSPLPDPTLTSDLANDLLEPATKAAVRGSIGKLTQLGIGNPGLTIEAMMRDMLRPMLKEWLDENLPSVVERMVEKEIARVARGE